MGLNSLTFGDVNTLDYGVYILSDPTFNAPKRVYKTVEVPGRNGLVAIDEGYYENITITYPAYIEADTFEEFSEKVSDFRNALMSQSGYQRLYNTYHPDEYRMALFQDDFILDITKYLKTGRFDLTFNCKPQRYLVSGDSAITVASGSELVNPTPFEARPLIIVTADDDGVLSVNDQQIMYLPESIGNIALDNSRPITRKAASTAWTSSATASWSFSRYNTGDNLSPDIDLAIVFKAEFPSVVGVNVDSGGLTNMTRRNATHTTHFALFNLAIPRSAISFKAGTAKTVSFSFYGIVEYESGPSSGTLGSEVEFAGTVAYDGDNTITVTANGNLPEGALSTEYNLEVFPQYSVDSTRAVFEGTVYFDTDVCEAYIYDGDDMISVNNVVVTGADFPKLLAGVNNISYDGGIQTCKIIPRWWII